MPNGLLEDFVQYCTSHPEERFWQALRNWSGKPFILASDVGPCDFYHPITYEDPSNPMEEIPVKLEDTFYWTDKDGASLAAPFLSPEELEKEFISMQEAHGMVVLAGKSIPVFNNWMNGQTCPILSDGTLGYYRSDVERFLAGKPIID